MLQLRFCLIWSARDLFIGDQLKQVDELISCSLRYADDTLVEMSQTSQVERHFILRISTDQNHSRLTHNRTIQKKNKELTKHLLKHVAECYPIASAQKDYGPGYDLKLPTPSYFSSSSKR